MYFTREKASSMLPIIQAFAEGKTIQLRAEEMWYDLPNPDFGATPEFYRIKPSFEVDQKTIDEAYQIWQLNEGNARQSMGPTLNFIINKIVQKIKNGEISLDDF